MLRLLVIGVAAGIWVASVALGEVWHVDAAVAVAGDGRSWAGAFGHLQDALTHGELAAGDEIWVAAGTYYPDRTAASPEGTDNPQAVFGVFRAIKMYGGFPPGGGDGTFGARDPATHPTVLSGLIYEPEHYVFDVCDEPPDGAGGCYTETPGFTGCDHPYCCMVVCDHLPFCCVNGWDDQCVEVAGDICGVYLSTHVIQSYDVGPETQIDGFTITGGSAHGSAYSVQELGGGMLLHSSASLTISNCTFTGNSAEKGGALALRYGGAPMLVNCTFVNNQAGIGGAVYVDYPYSSSPVFVNCLFGGNAAYEGPGSAVHAEIWADVALVNCTVVDNSSIDDGITAYNVDEIANCIFWANGATPIFGAGNVTSSCVEGGHDGEGNIDETPGFVDQVGGDYRLAYGSPCIDAGSDQALPPDRADLDDDLDTDEPTPLDLELKGRVLEAAVDMGAYEYCRRDLDGDGSVGVTDFLQLLAAWGVNPGHVADFDDSGDVGVTDLLSLLARWGPCR
ncbi:MAG: right-handed parallel beta-helix repeat-containing protein [Planctomycetota bacterium]